MVFKTWDAKKLKIVAEAAKTRIMQKDEVLFEDQTLADTLYFLVSGMLRIEKEVDVTNQNFWPTDDCEWLSTKVTQRVLFKIADIKPFQLVGER